MNRSSDGLAVRGGVSRRADRCSWKGSIHQGYNACSKGHSEIKCQAEALGAILAGVDARRGRQGGTAEVDNKRCTFCGQLRKQLQGQRSATIM